MRGLPDLTHAVPARSALIGEGLLPVPGRYHPRWAAHRTIVTSARELHRFWSNPPAAFTDPARIVPVGASPDGTFVHPPSGWGVLADPHGPVGLIIGHGTQIRQRGSREDGI